MERITQIARKALELRQLSGIYESAVASNAASASAAAPSDPRALTLVKRLCALLKIRLRPDKTGSMLGGAYARLRLWSWTQPGLGGSIWYDEALSPDDLAFSIAHELGHYTLHRGEGEIVHGPCNASQIDQHADIGALRDGAGRLNSVEEYSPRVRRELEASAFAAELLAPRAAVRRAFLASDTHDARWLAEAFGVSLGLARRRLSDALLTADPFSLPETNETPEQHDDASLSLPPNDPLTMLDAAQLAAACANGPALVVAGPGTGKTATLAGRVAYLINKTGAQPEQIIALTFSNRAASEMRERLNSAKLPGERIPVMTIHAFAAGLLREYAPHVPHAENEPPLAADFRILDSADNYLLIEEILPTLRLRYYHTMTGQHDSIKELAEDFSQARNALLSLDGYLALVQQMPMAPQTPTITTGKGKSGQTKRPAGTFTQLEIDKAHERALAYGAWERALRRRGLVDFGGLIMRAVELLRARPDILSDAQARFAHLLVDEFQDTNLAAAELLFLLAGADGKGFWVVGDHKQAIYRWRGAAPQNLERLLERYPQAGVYPLTTCYRSVPDLVATGLALAMRMSEPSAHTALAPISLSPARAANVPSGAALYRAEGLEDADAEAAILALTISRLHASGYAYRDQAILCRKGAQVARLAQALAALDIPVAESEEFFASEAIKDALTFLSLAAGPDGQGLLRANTALQAMGLGTVASGKLIRLIKYFALEQEPLPGALTKPALLTQAGASKSEQRSLKQLGDYMLSIYFEHDSGSMGGRLGQLLLRPGGYAWRLAHIADGSFSGAANGQRQDQRRGFTQMSQAEARAALAALGELMRLAFRFDVRWRDEPDFRAGMIGIVNQTVTAPTREISPSATDTQVGMNEIEEDEKAPMVRCFLQYIRALRLSNVQIKAPTGADDAVALMTLHASKGLEFPVVYLPYLTEGEFPLRSPGPRKVNPPNFSVIDDPNEAAAEERCLFYVGLTRARDIAMLSWARYSAKHSQRSSLLGLLDDDPYFQQAGSLLTGEDTPLIDTYRQLLAARRKISASIDDDESDDDLTLAAPSLQSPKPILEAQPIHQPAPVIQPGVIHSFYALKNYLDCPLRYRYTEEYGFRAGAPDGAMRYHRSVRWALYDLIDLRAEHPEATWDDASRQIALRWRNEGQANRPYAIDYLRHIEKVLRIQWDELLDDDMSRRGRRQIAHQQELLARLDAGAVRVNADLVISEQMADGRTQVTLAWVRSGLQHDNDAKDLRLLLYALAYQQHYPGAHPRIVIRYLGASLLTLDPTNQPALDSGTPDTIERVDAPDAPGITGRPTTLDVTEKIEHDLRSYEGGKRSRLRALDRAMAGIAAGKFQAKPEEQKCAACHFCFACPTDPADEAEAAEEAALSSQPMRAAYE